MKIEGEKLDWFGVDATDDRGCVAECHFSATYDGQLYHAYGSYESLDVYAVDHGPTQRDVNIISALLDDGFEPAAGVQV